MALVTVSTFSEFLTAIATAGNTIMLANDIDANGYIFTSTKYIYSDIDGNGHTIWNLQNDGTNNGLFVIASGVTIQNVNFYNIYASWTFFTPSGTSGAHVVIKNCNFQGRVAQLITGTYLDMSFCVINMISVNRQMIGTSYANVSQCYLNHGETATTVVGNGSGNWFYNYNSCKYTDCYFSGKVHITTTSGHEFIAGGGQSKNCVINVDVAYQGVTTGTFTIGSGFSTGTGISIFNNSKITTTLNNSAGNTQMYPLTDTEMKDRNSIATVGFPIL